ncbi:G-type lectin S-receptor-like serine/threonine-protein kinase [Vitis vinifera]|uniref:non-specific serine/threonine protein kinase n=1 Tax=Vitis vinifera TaxID=29760 RepID=A0A438DP97_VITVI|nr:G-type lectin S-receptor-like serine/threonine-protein kinase [Vitis vinifera]
MEGFATLLVGAFELGFFSPDSSKNRYVGIWYKKVATRTVVWVANRQIPLTDSSGILKVTDRGTLVILNGMKFGRNRVTGLDRYLSSWKTTDDPSIGNFTYRLDPGGSPQLLVRNGSTVTFRSGPWNGLRFSGFPQLRPNSVYSYAFIFNDKETYYTFELVNSSVITRLVLSPEGYAQRFTWIDRTSDWILYSSAQTDDCDSYALCGVYGICEINRSPKCECMKGFEPKFQSNWDMADWSDGCVRSTPMVCQKSNGFLKYSDIRGGGSGCLVWFGDLIDIREYTENGQDFYIRMAKSELDAFAMTNSGSKGAKRKWVIVSTVSIVGMILLSLVLTLYVLRKKRLRRKGAEINEREEDLELPLFDLDTILNATDNFSNDNKLGEGGFGPVYKGMLQDGKEIAVKRLSKESRQGLDEFKNEVTHISKLQHRNLVKLLGCCIHGEEKMLIYEYMPNKSLDFFIFDGMQSLVLDWPKRFVIINGIARGLLYLHQDSRLRIIHRDLKADNVLLDNEMNPRISDFGMARSFRGNESEARTKRVVGTYGYMSPEYAIDGVYSIKSDVFSFGVLVLEIVTGKRNRGFNHPDHALNLLGHAWTLYMEGKPLELIDASMGDSYNQSEVLRALNVGLLCVQRSPDDRPSMSSVVLMLSSESALHQPKEPGFFTERNVLEGSSSASKHAIFSGNEHTITLIEGR